MESFANSHYLPQWSARRWSPLPWCSCWCAFSGSTGTSGGAPKGATRATPGAPPPASPAPPHEGGGVGKSRTLLFLLVDDGLDLLPQPVERVEPVQRRFRASP